METETHARFRSANEELREFLRRIVSLANGAAALSENELQRGIQHLMKVTPEIGDASRAETLNPDLQDQIAEYVKNFRALQRAMARIHCVALARRIQLQATKPHVDGLEDRAHMYQQIRD
jgi:cephalosporin-C deacetylase-like acetyl esterase